MNDINIFCNILRKRSEDNQQSFNVLYANRLYGNCFSVLRQELDSIVRAIYLLDISDIELRNNFILQTLNGEKWSYINEKCKKVIITDKIMVELADRLTSWVQSVYKFGCGFIHLSNFHNYETENPFAKLSIEERSSIIEHMRCYHGAILDHDSSMKDFIPYLPRVMDKISCNLKSQIDSIEKERMLD